KPANIMIDASGRAVIVDFGVARGTVGPAVHNTSSGAIVGTPLYMAPEQLQGRLGDHRMDQFSFCLCLYTALVGQPPFPGTTFQERRLIVPLGLGEPERERLNHSRKIPPRVRRALLRGLSIDPAARFESMDALLAELEERRRWPWMVSVVTLVLGVGLGALLGLGRQDEPCRSPSAALGDAWSPARAQALTATLLATKHPDARGLGKRVEKELDAYAEAWKSAYTASCEATYVTQEQSEALFDRRMQCLQRRRSRLEAAIEVLGGATDPDSLDRRASVAFQLPPIAECSDRAALERRVPLPEDPERRQSIEVLYERIDRAETMRLSGAFDPGLVVAREVVERARAIDYDPVLAQALECLGRLQSDADSPVVAEQTLREALRIASRSKDPQLIARAWPSLIYAMALEGELTAGAQLGFAAEIAVEQAD
ncbi:MAG: protein kinase, partial [Myxococcales bacterium]|nr:protein kinase [Myxococcales bacterium]